MRAARLGLAVALVLVGLLAPPVARPERALACSLVPFEVDRALEEYPQNADAIVVVESIEESLAEGSEEPNVTDRWATRVRTLATLKGETPDEFTLPGLGWLGPSCEGGPRLREGERALLLLVHGSPGGDGWTIMAGGQGAIRNHDGTAAFDHSHLGEARLDVGPLDQAVADMGERVGASDQDMQAVVDALHRAVESPAPPVEEQPVDEQSVEEQPVEEPTDHRVGLVQVGLVLAAGVAALVVTAPIGRGRRRGTE